MRFNVLALTAFLPVAGLLSGCAMGTQGVTSAAATPASKTVKGKSFGGQQAVAGGQIVVYQYGTGGYGTTATPIATTVTDAAGNFNVNYPCTDPNAPVYILSLGGRPGLNLPNNSAIVLGAGLGTCATSETGYVTINEISTTVLAFSLSHFFSTNGSDTNTPDTFGAPTSLTPAITRVNSVLIPTMISVQNGYPNPSSATFTNEGAKILTLADILGACVNSAGPDSPACSNLFQFTTPSGGTAPTDTLQAAVNMALNPGANVAQLYAQVPPSGSSAFSGSLPTQPNDWTIAVSYTTPTLGLGIDPFTVTTLDIDSSGRVWFPSNLPGAAGLAYFDPGSSSFSAPQIAAGLVRPEQVVVDINGYAWTNDTQSPNIAGFPAATAAPVVLSLPGTTSTAVTVDDDNSLRLAVVNTASASPAFASVTNETTYTQIPNTTPQQSTYYIGTSLAGDTVGGNGAAATDTSTPNVYDLYIRPDSAESFVLFQGFADAGQVAFTGTDFVSTRGGFNAADDGLCVYSAQNCFPFANQAANRHPAAAAVDGGGNVWLSDFYTQDVQQVPLSANGSYVSGNLVNSQVFAHGTDNGSTLGTAGGIGIDNTGNVWVSNVSCAGIGCTPGPFVLTELIGAGVPTVTPISAQVVLNGTPGMKPAAKASKLAR